MKFDKYEINKVQLDEFGRPNGIIAYDKPAGITSHDVVDIMRREYGTRQVGHAGTLDPFATGLLIILIGKATKLSDQFLNLDKEYVADILLGVGTDSGDVDGKILNIKDEKLRMKEKIEYKDLGTKLQEFLPGYIQTVPVFSSVKVGGKKLRELARKYERFTIVNNETMKQLNSRKIIQFYKDNKIVETVNLPQKAIKIYEIELLGLENISKTDLKDKYYPNFRGEEDEFQIAKVRVKCSKGTYIRQLAMDLGVKLGVQAMLVGLRRTRAGEISVP